MHARPKEHSDSDVSEGGLWQDPLQRGDYSPSLKTYKSVNQDSCSLGLGVGL